MDHAALKELARRALSVQDASNLSGVVHAWSADITKLRAALPEADTDTLNRHPINKLWASKVNSLACADDEFSAAYDACCQLSEQ